MPALLLLAKDGQKIVAKNGDSIGRTELGADYQLKFPTVSPKHIQVFKRERTWYLKNISTSSRAYVNEQEVPWGAEREIKAGDELRLSVRCHLKIL